MEFDSFGALGRHFGRLALVGEAVTEHVAQKGGEAIQTDAQSRIGAYQDAVGPFPAWAELAESTVDDRLRHGFSPDEPLLRTGELRDSIEVTTKGDTAVIGTPDPVAAYQEFGTSTIPPRPFLGPAAIASEHAVGTIAAETLVAWIAGVGWRSPRIKLTDL